MSFQDYLKISVGEINREVESFLTVWDKETGEISQKLLPLSKTFIEACQGGKGLRGVLVKMGYELAIQKNNPEILKVAAAYEIFNTAILAHDDIIDQSPTRRGKKTIYKALGGNHYAISQTICLGDIGFFLAVRIIAGSKFNETVKNKALESFARVVSDTGAGEMLDVALPLIQEEKQEEDVLQIFRLKTAEYTITGPLKLGAILGEADDNLLQNLGKFGEALGIAFQIQDDILGVFGSEEEIGKSTTSDIEEGKITLLYIYAKKHASLDEQKVLEKYYGTGKIGQKEAGLVKKVFTDSGALGYAQKRAEKLVSQAKVMIPEITKDAQMASYLNDLADLLIKRKN